VADRNVGADRRFEVVVRRRGGGWWVGISDRGRVVSERACSDEAEAELYASTVRQHAGWLSQERFREYYRLEA
jgi:hypothetical protein